MIEGCDPPVLNVYLFYRIAAVIAQVGNASVKDVLGSEGCKEMDSHANMCVLGKHCYLLTKLETAQTVSVGVFSKSARDLNNVPIVDTMLANDCERTNQVYLLVLRNALYIESMDDNLIPPFILQEDGITVDKRVKIHCGDSGTKEDPTIQEGATGLFITMQLRNIFFYFLSRKSNLDDLDDGVVVTITPEGFTWDAYN